MRSQAPLESYFTRIRGRNRSRRRLLDTDGFHHGVLVESTPREHGRGTPLHGDVVRRRPEAGLHHRASPLEVALGVVLHRLLANIVRHPQPVQVRYRAPVPVAAAPKHGAGLDGERRVVDQPEALQALNDPLRLFAGEAPGSEAAIELGCRAPANRQQPKGPLLAPVDLSQPAEVDQRSVLDAAAGPQPERGHAALVDAEPLAAAKLNLNERAPAHLRDRLDGLRHVPAGRGARRPTPPGRPPPRWTMSGSRSAARARFPT